MHVAYPEVRRRVLEHHLEVDARETGREARCGDCEEALQRVHRVRKGCHRRCRAMCRAARLDLDDADADGKQQQREPLPRRELLSQQEHGKRGGREDFHLVCDLERRSVEV